MAIMRVDDYEVSASQNAGSSNFVFFNISIDPKAKSPEKLMELKPGGKKAHGYYEDGWFLAKWTHTVVISIHRKRNSKELVLCNKSFESEGNSPECPACESYFNAADRQAHFIGAKEQRLLIPFLATQKQENPQIYKGKFELLPIYWFEMNVTNYIEGYYANFLRLREANEKHPIHKSPYRIFKKERGEQQKQEYYFKALKENDSHAITVEHPIIDEWLSKDGKWKWNSDYLEILSALAIARFKQYVDPSTKEVFDYGGQYEAAMDTFNELKERYGDPRTPIEGASEEADNEELDD